MGDTLLRVENHTTWRKGLIISSPDRPNLRVICVIDESIEPNVAKKHKYDVKVTREDAVGRTIVYLEEMTDKSDVRKVDDPEKSAKDDQLQTYTDWLSAQEQPEK